MTHEVALKLESLQLQLPHNTNQHLLYLQRHKVQRHVWQVKLY